MAPDEDPPPPKHCLEDMDKIAPLYEKKFPHNVDNSVGNNSVVIRDIAPSAGDTPGLVIFGGCV
jgi:hypothetical protein